MFYNLSNLQHFTDFKKNYNSLPQFCWAALDPGPRPPSKSLVLKLDQLWRVHPVWQMLKGLNKEFAFSPFHRNTTEKKCRTGASRGPTQDSSRGHLSVRLKIGYPPYSHALSFTLLKQQFYEYTYSIPIFQTQPFTGCPGSFPRYGILPYQGAWGIISFPSICLFFQRDHLKYCRHHLQIKVTDSNVSIAVFTVFDQKDFPQFGGSDGSETPVIQAAGGGSSNSVITISPGSSGADQSGDVEEDDVVG